MNRHVMEQKDTKTNELLLAQLCPPPWAADLGQLPFDWPVPMVKYSACHCCPHPPNHSYINRPREAQLLHTCPIPKGKGEGK